MSFKLRLQFLGSDKTALLRLDLKAVSCSLNKKNKKKTEAGHRKKYIRWRNYMIGSYLVYKWKTFDTEQMCVL